MEGRSTIGLLRQKVTMKIDTCYGTGVPFFHFLRLPTYRGEVYNLPSNAKSDL